MEDCGQKEKGEEKPEQDSLPAGSLEMQLLIPIGNLGTHALQPALLTPKTPPRTRTWRARWQELLL